jgi:hypothetical protein
MDNLKLKNQHIIQRAGSLLLVPSGHLEPGILMEFLSPLPVAFIFFHAGALNNFSNFIIAQ